MFRLVGHKGVLGVSRLESGDPKEGQVSGELTEAGTCEQVLVWMQEAGAIEEDGVFFLPLDESFLVVHGENTPVPFAEGGVICVPAEDEIFLELSGIPGPEYSYFFPQHLAAVEKD